LLKWETIGSNQVLNTKIKNRKALSLVRIDVEILLGIILNKLHKHSGLKMQQLIKAIKVYKSIEKLSLIRLIGFPPEHFRVRIQLTCFFPQKNRLGNCIAF